MSEPKPTKRDSAARRQSIIDAAIRVIGRDGLGALTHRAVATEAGVPLGLTTYYFADKTDLARTALEAARAGMMTRDEILLNRLIAERGVVIGVTSYILELTGPAREQLAEDYRVYVSALYSPTLRGSATWRESRMLASVLPSGVAFDVGIAIDGLLLHSVMNDQALDQEQVEPLVRRLVEPGA